MPPKAVPAQMDLGGLSQPPYFRSGFASSLMLILVVGGGGGYLAGFLRVKSGETPYKRM